MPVTPPPVATPESTPEPTPQPPPPLPPAEPAPKPPPVVEPPPPPSVTLHPRRPVDTWAIFREAERDELDAACEARWTGGRRLEIKTDNVRRLTLDLTRLPPDAPRQGPWNVQIDGQGVEITGFTPKPGYTGKVRDLVRSPNGNWTVDKKRLYRGGL